MALKTTDSSFFSEKRSWSKIKDRVLGTYMVPYLSKVKTLQRPILLIDAFAGPGRFEDGSVGSPVIICEAAERYAKGQYLAIFVNEKKKHHQLLSEELSPLIEKGKVIPIHGTAANLLSEVEDRLRDHTVFLYLDPFGLKGCEFSMIEPFLRRDKTFSTEIIINISVPTLHRLAATKAVMEGRNDTPLIDSYNNRLSQVLGGDYWKTILWDEFLQPESKADQVVNLYREQLAQYDLPYTGSCPVRERKGRAIKYYITFCSRHPDAMKLMNDIMCKAYNEYLYEIEMKGTLFQNTGWRTFRSLDKLKETVLEMLPKRTQISRCDLWVDLVQDSFMRYVASEYIAAVANLVNEGKIDYIDVRGTGRLNDDSILFSV